MSQLTPVPSEDWSSKEITKLKYLHDPKETSVIIIGKMGFSSAPALVHDFLKENGYISK
jgi:hypothetical protein